MQDDIPSSVLPQLGELADNIRVLVANGQLDLCIPYRLTANYLRKMAWGGTGELDSAQRNTW